MRSVIFGMWLWLVLVFGFLGNFGQAYSQAYNFNYLTIQQGLPQSQAFSIMFDSDHYAWIGTQGGGVCRYDGESYRYFTKNDSLISNRVFVVKEWNKQIWVGQKGGASVFALDGAFIQNYYLPNDGAAITDIIFYENEQLFATTEGLYKREKNALVKKTENPNLIDVNIHSFFQPTDQALWLCTDNGLLSYKNVFGKLNKAKGLTFSHVECAVEFNNEWVLGAYEGGVNFYDKNKVYQKEAFNELNDKIILSLFVSGQNELWIGTMNDGLYLFNAKDGTLRNFRTTNGLSSNHIKVIASDFWDNIWIGTSGGGVSIFRNSPFIEYNSASGLNGNYVFSVLNDSQNNLWLGTEGKGVMRINDTSKVLFDEDHGFFSEKVKCIFEDFEGDIWFGTEGHGLGVDNVRDQKDTIYSFYNTNGLTGNWVKCFEENPKLNIVYVGTNDGGIYYTVKSRGIKFNQTFKPLKINNGEMPKEINALQLINGRLWFVTDSGNYGFVFNEKIVTKSEKGRSFRNVVSTKNTLWIGSKDDGILRLKMLGDSIIEKSWITTASNAGISSNNIYQLMYHKNQLWVGTEKGLDRLDLDSANQVVGHEHFGFEEGFEGVETNINAGSVDHNGDLWFGTVDGLFVYKGREPNQAQRKPPVLKLYDFQIVFESIEKTPYAKYYEDGKLIQPLILPYDQNHISFQFKALHYAYAKNIRYRWKLEGLDPDWTPATSVNIATYPNLLPGNYVFRVQAAIDDNWSQQPIEVQFTIDQPYWEKFWFKVGYYGLAFILLGLIILTILVRQKKKSRALNEKLKLEKNLLELEQKALRLQMNPHFIFNVLNSIHNLIILNDSDKARYALSKFSKLMRQVLENSREKFISIDAEIETLQNYVQLERLTSNVSIELNFNIDESIDTSEEMLPPLMIQPFVENAIVHGLKGMDKEGEIEVSFNWFGENVLECSIADNGIGRKKAGEIKAQQGSYHKSTALKVAQERLANLNKETAFVPFEIIDRKNDQGLPAGTIVIIRILV